MIILHDRDFNHHSLYHREIGYGGKSKGLIMLKNLGLNVPRFFIITELHGEETLRLISNRLLEEIKKGHIDGYKKYSVRSSATTEDSSSHSFAGIFESYLNVPMEDLPRRILDCVNSRNSKKVETYLLENHIPSDELKMSVIVQEMVKGEKSGVLFSSNPNGLISESLIVTGEGDGEEVISGRVPTSTTYLSNLEDVYYTENLKGARTIDKTHLAELKKTGLMISKEAGHPCDIEFTIKEGKIYYLQVRPVTAVGEGVKIILDNKNLLENYPGICLPLTDSFVRETYSSMFTGLGRKMINNEYILEGYQEELNNMITSSTGRMYYKINNWNTLIGFLPFSGKARETWKKHMGIPDMEGLKTKNIPLFQKLKFRINFFKEYYAHGKRLERLKEAIGEAEDMFKERTLKVMNNEEIKSLYWIIVNNLAKVIPTFIMHDIYTFFNFNMGEDNKSKDQIAAVSNLESIKPLKKLSEIAKHMGKVDIRTKEEAEEFLSRNCDEAFMINDFINEYGDRYIEEMKLESKNFKTHPQLIFRIIKELEDTEFDTNVEQTVEKKGLFKRVFFNNALGAIKERDYLRIYKGKIYGMARTLFLMMGENLKRENRIHEAEDIFYLTREELFRDKTDENLRWIIDERKRKYNTFRNIPEYNTMEFLNSEFDRTHVAIETGEIYSTTTPELKGQPILKGKVEGTVKIVRDPLNASDVKDSIVVLEHMGPGYIYLFPQVKAIVCETSSVLSHSAIILRELGKPALVGVMGAASILKDGEKIILNLDEARIERK